MLLEHPDSEMVSAAAQAEKLSYVATTIGEHILYATYTFVGSASNPLPEHPHLLIPGNLFYDFDGRHWRYLNLMNQWVTVDIAEPPFHPRFSALRLQVGNLANDIPSWVFQRPDHLDDYPELLEERRGRLGHRDNAWLLIYLDCWMLQQRDFLQWAVADSAIEALVTTRHPLKRIYGMSNAGTFKIGHHPTFEIAMNSLASAAASPELSPITPHIFDYDQLSVAAEGLTIQDFLRNFRDSAVSPRCLGVLEVPFSNDLSPNAPEPNLSLHRFRVPTNQARSLILVPEREDQPQDLLQTAAYLMRGAVTSPHQDYYLLPMLLHHIAGVKLWLMWPQNDHNLKYFRRPLILGDGEICRNSVPEAIERLTEMTILVADKPNMVFTVPIGMFHACISITDCVHVNSKAVDLRQVEYVSSVVVAWENAFRHCMLDAKIGGARGSFTVSELQNSRAAYAIMFHFSQWVGCVRRQTMIGAKRRSMLQLAAKRLVSLWDDFELTYSGPDEEDQQTFPRRRELLKLVGAGDWSQWFE